ncbi:MAG: RagB/SusD family nutrient uptake outer membrane protein [Tannerellaceae bacterium]|nr:RagB/SusD family nutrient uptake outer membrane protein [Tannerellaceae bacterium]
MKDMKHIWKYSCSILCSLAILVYATSCTDLNEEVFSEITEDTYEYSPGDASRLLASVYADLRYYIGFYTYYIQEICTDEMVQPANAAGWDDGGVYRRMHLHTWNAEQTHVIDHWATTYTGILLANRTIHLLSEEGFPFSPTENKESMLAETRALRAYYYWNALDNYGDVPLVTEPTDEFPDKTSRKEVYDFVVKELLECMNDLPEVKSTANYGRFTKWAAKALLANVYLNAEVYTGTPQWEACIAQCNDIINSNQYQLDNHYLDPFKVYNENSLENIFVIPFDHVYAPGFEIYKACLHAANQDTYQLQDGPWGPGSYKAVPQFIDTYDEEDERLDVTWLKGQQYGADGSILTGFYDMMGEPLVFVNSMLDGIFTGEADGYRMVKYEIEVGSRTFMNNDFVVFRLAQVYMMKAECLLRTGNADGAAELVTFVRQRAFRNHPEKARVTGSQLQESSRYVYGTVENYVLTPQGKQFPEQYGRMYDELGWEFVGEMFRRRDMIRFGHFTKAEWLSHKPNGDHRSVFPIPQKTVDSNPNLEQNPDYVE